MIYGKIKMELKYFLNFKLVLVTRKANTPPYRIEIRQVNTAKSSVFHNGFHRFVLASRLVNKST